jgi:hypothetical protein
MPPTNGASAPRWLSSPLTSMTRPIFKTILATSIAIMALCCAPRSVPDAIESAFSADPLTLSTASNEDWITTYDPQRAWNGYTLAFVFQRIPILMDMNGREVHRWPTARLKSRARLLADGSLLGIALGRGVVEYDWNGVEAWRYTADNGFAHHDVIRLANGNTMTLIRPDDDPFDEVIEIDRAGRVVWRWQSGDSLRPFVPAEAWGNKDLTHMNSVQELPENPWYDRGDERFRPGNLLVSARDLDRVFVIDKQTREVTWTYQSGLQKQHEPWMIGPGYPETGRILLFNNRIRSFYADRQSTIEELDPISNRVVWQYRSAGFHSPTSGVQQHLPNGNVLITSTRGGRTFEVTRAGRVVWEWVPPFDPMRSRRYSYDHSPQLAAMSRPMETRVSPSDSYRHIDADIYRFAGRGLLRQVEIAGENRKGILKYGNDCRELVLPAAATADLEYGVARDLALQAEHREFSADFRLSVRRVGVDELTDVFHDQVDLRGFAWREATVDLSPFALQHVQLCIATEQSGLPPAAADTELAFWRRPVIRPGPVTEPPASTDELLDDLTAEELETRKKHLEALGYIN